MTVYSEIVRQSQVAHDARYPAPVTGSALVHRHIAAVEGVIAYRALYAREVVKNGRSAMVTGIALHHYRAALRSLIATRRLLAGDDLYTRAAAREAELSVCEDSAGDAYTIAARRHLWARLIEPFANERRAIEATALVRAAE